MKKEVIDQIKEADFVVERAYRANKWLRDNYYKLFNDNDFLAEWKEKYEDDLFKARLYQHIYGRCIYKQTIKALNNIECYTELFNEPCLIKAIKKKPVLETLVVGLLNKRNPLIQAELRQLMIDFIEGDKLAMVLIDFKKRLIGKNFEEPLMIEYKEDTNIKKSAFKDFTSKLKALLR